MIDDNNIVSCAITFNDFFENAVKALDVKISPEFEKNLDDIRDPVMKEIKRYKSHPSTLKIKEVFVDPKPFNFEFITIDVMFTEIKSLNAPKETLPIKIIQENINICAHPVGCAI